MCERVTMTFSVRTFNDLHSDDALYATAGNGDTYNVREQKKRKKRSALNVRYIYALRHYKGVVTAPTDRRGLHTCIIYK